MIVKNIYDLTLVPEPIHGGEGLCPHANMIPGKDFDTPIRFLNYTVLPEGASFGDHKHGDDNELYIVLSGEGIYTEDGVETSVRKGSVMVNKPFGTHGIRNTGRENLELLVMEVYNAQHI